MFNYPFTETKLHRTLEIKNATFTFPIKYQKSPISIVISSNMNAVYSLRSKSTVYWKIEVITHHRNTFVPTIPPKTLLPSNLPSPNAKRTLLSNFETVKLKVDSGSFLRQLAPRAAICKSSPWRANARKWNEEDEGQWTQKWSSNRGSRWRRSFVTWARRSSLRDLSRMPSKSPPTMVLCVAILKLELKFCLTLFVPIVKRSTCGLCSPFYRRKTF